MDSKIPDIGNLCWISLTSPQEDLKHKVSLPASSPTIYERDGETSSSFYPHTPHSSSSALGGLARELLCSAFHKQLVPCQAQEGNLTNPCFPGLRDL